MPLALRTDDQAKADITIARALSGHPRPFVMAVELFKAAEAAIATLKGDAVAIDILRSRASRRTFRAAKAVTRMGTRR